MGEAWKNRKLVAWGRSKLLMLHLQHHPLQFEFCVDENAGTPFPIPIVSPEKADLKDKLIVIFAVSNAGLNAIKSKLGLRDFIYGKDFIFYADLYFEEMNALARKIDFNIEENHHLYAKSFTLNSIKPVHTTITGTSILLGIVEKIIQKRNPLIAEIGSFEGGNVYSIMQFLAAKNAKIQKYFVFDSFEGFPDLTTHDPATFGKGSYKTQRTFQDIRNDFAIYDNVQIIKGFVPETFKHLDPKLKFDLVFYDCDLYQPALDTLEYFWDRMNPGGYIVLHDYMHEPGGFAGVEKATKEFLLNKNIAPVIFWPSTMAVIQR